MDQEDRGAARQGGLPPWGAVWLGMASVLFGMVVAWSAQVWVGLVFIVMGLSTAFWAIRGRRHREHGAMPYGLPIDPWQAAFSGLLLLVIAGFLVYEGFRRVSAEGAGERLLGIGGIALSLAALALGVMPFVLLIGARRVASGRSARFAARLFPSLRTKETGPPPE